MEIAVNKCYGGFKLSEEAILELIKMNSDLVKKSKLSEWEKDGLDFSSRLELFKDGFRKHRFYHLLEKDGEIYSYDRAYNYKNRTHQDLIKVIKKLKNKVNTSVSKIEIIQIPDDVDWEIDKYDGIESIHEKHRSW